MKSESAMPADPLHLLRQQLILSQVRIMELEDMRDELLPKQAELERLLAAAQALADQKLDESAHLGKINADLQGQNEHLRHLQQVTNTALQAAHRAEADRLNQTISRLGLDLASATSLATTQAARIQELDAEAKSLKASRSWRWTRWLRALERMLGGEKS